MTFSVDEFFAYSQPFGPVEKEQKSQISTLIDSGISLKWRTTQTIEKHRYYTIETHPVIKNELVYLKTQICCYPSQLHS